MHVAVTCYVREELGKVVETRVEGELKVGNVVRCPHTRTGQKQTLIEVSKHLLTIRGENGFTRTLMLRKPIFVNESMVPDDRGTD